MLKLTLYIILVVLVAFKVEAEARTPMDKNDDNFELCVIPKPVLTETSGEEKNYRN